MIFSVWAQVEKEYSQISRPHIHPGLATALTSESKPLHPLSLHRRPPSRPHVTSPIPPFRNTFRKRPLRIISRSRVCRCIRPAPSTLNLSCDPTVLALLPSCGPLASPGNPKWLNYFQRSEVRLIRSGSATQSGSSEWQRQSQDLCIIIMHHPSLPIHFPRSPISLSHPCHHGKQLALTSFSRKTFGTETRTFSHTQKMSTHKDVDAQVRSLSLTTNRLLTYSTFARKLRDTAMKS